ncbi:hypothetical protein, partial [Pseudaeromonas pectinilytica]
QPRAQQCKILVIGWGENSQQHVKGTAPQKYGIAFRQTFHSIENQLKNQILKIRQRNTTHFGN